MSSSSEAQNPNLEMGLKTMKRNYIKIPWCKIEVVFSLVSLCWIQPPGLSKRIIVSVHASFLATLVALHLTAIVGGWVGSNFEACELVFSSPSLSTKIEQKVKIIPIQLVGLSKWCKYLFRS